MTEEKIHRSVMVEKAITELHIKNQAIYIDATLGTGGHTLEILKLGGNVIGIDMDPEMIEIAKTRIEKEIKDVSRFQAFKGNFSEIDKIAKKLGVQQVSGILFDLGVSNIHLKDLERGFSFGNPDAPLDMRLNLESQGVKAMDLLNVLRPDQLKEMFMVTLGPGPSKWLTMRVQDYKKSKKIETVADFLEICKGLKSGKTGLSEATLPFLALRIAVNSELDNLKNALPKAFDLLQTGGRIVVISFHSGEDRIVKEFSPGSKLILPDILEVQSNPRARSAKMRIIQK